MSRNEGEGRHPATATRLQTAREEGDVAHSSQLSGSIQLLAVIVLAWLFIGNISNGLEKLARDWWTESTIDASQFDPAASITEALTSVGVAVLPLFILLFGFAVVSHLLQTGPMFLPSRVSFDVSRLDPTHWLQKVFSPANFCKTLLDLPKIVVVLAAAGIAIYSNIDSILSLGANQVGEMMGRMFGLLLRIGFQTALLLFLFGLLDYAFSWWGRSNRLMMTDQQLRDEIRMQQGNPQTTQRQRQLLRERI